jgi:hypothetical protein
VLCSHCPNNMLRSAHQPILLYFIPCPLPPKKRVVYFTCHYSASSKRDETNFLLLLILATRGRNETPAHYCHLEWEVATIILNFLWQYATWCKGMQVKTYVRGATIRHPFHGYAFFSDPKISARTGFIKFVQLPGLFRNALSHFNRTGDKINLLLFKRIIIYYSLNIKKYEFSSRPSEYAVQLRQYSWLLPLFLCVMASVRRE